MKRAGKIAVCLAGGLALNAGLRAADTVSDNPYETIVTRNIFGLNPIPVGDPSKDTPQPAVKITPNGIMTLFGQLQVLFKTAGGPNNKEQSYILAEGQRQDDIEVVKINEKAGIITFINHGITQELPLANAPALNTPMPAFAGTPGNNSAIPARVENGGNGGGRNGRFGNYGGGRRGAGNGNNGNNNGGDNSGTDNGLNLRNIPTRTYQPEASTMTPEEQVIMIEAQRQKYQAEGNPMAKILPPTVMTPQVNGGGATPPVP
jgi:hypothetical protein